MSNLDVANTLVTAKSPQVSIGMPVYNGGKFIREALDSLLAQTFTDFELIISDNASTDATELICREYAARDLRIYYVRHEANRGAPANFQFVLDKARGEYFMWAAADDVRSPDFLELNYSFLEKHPDYVTSTSPVKFEGGRFNPIKMGDASLTGNIADRVEKFFQSWHANGRFYSLMRASSLKACPYVMENFFGSDWAVMLYVITQGKTNRHCDGCVVLGREGFSNSGRIFEHYRILWIHWALPFFELNGVVLNISKNFPIHHKMKILKSLVVLSLLAVYVSTKIEAKKKLKIIAARKFSGE